MSSSSIVCVDASVVLRKILQPDNESAKKTWGMWTSQQYRLVSPTLLFYEVTNGLYQYQKLGLLSPETIRDALEFAISMPIELVGEIGLHQRALEIAIQYKLFATYDAHYLALAELMDIDLWTADARLINALKPFKLGWVKGI